MNSKVNNLAVELEQFRLHLELIPGTRNLLADSLSRLLDVIPDPPLITPSKNQDDIGSLRFRNCLKKEKKHQKVRMHICPFSLNFLSIFATEMLSYLLLHVRIE